MSTVARGDSWLDFDYSLCLPSRISAISKYRQKLAAPGQSRNEKLEQDLRLPLRGSPKRSDEEYNIIYDGLGTRLGLVSAEVTVRSYNLLCESHQSAALDMAHRQLQSLFIELQRLAIVKLNNSIDHGTAKLDLLHTTSESSRTQAVSILSHHFQRVFDDVADTYIFSPRRHQMVWQTISSSYETKSEKAFQTSQHGRHVSVPFH